MSIRTQIIKCKCGAVRAAAHEPFCHEDSDWKKALVRGIRAGYKIDMVDYKKLREMTWECTCKKGG